MNHELTVYGNAIDIDSVDTHLIHECWDVLNGELVLLLLQSLEVLLCMLDLPLHRAELSNQIAESLAGCGVHIPERTGLVENVVKDIGHKFFLFRVACGQLVC